MKNIFSEYYPISKDVIDKVWDKGIFCYDANVLLNLYRYSKDTRNKIFENIEYFMPKTIMPYQACYEYHKNKRSVEDSLLNSYDKIIDIINKTVQSLETGELAGYRKHCALDIDVDIIKPLKSTTTRIVKKLNETKDNHLSYLNAIEIHEKISQLFEGKISDKFSEEDLKKIYIEGKGRYDKKIPPGFADYENKKNLGENSLYGDLIIWKHIIEISKLKSADIIFVTDDRKKDWWDIHHGQTKGALPELLREFKELTTNNILIYSVEDYMKYAPEHSAIHVPQNVINEIEELRKVDERRNNYNDFESYTKLIKKLNTKNNIWINIDKQKEFLSEFNNPKKLVIYTKALEELHKAIKDNDYMSNYLELIETINDQKLNPNIEETINTQKEWELIRKVNREDDE